MSTVEAAFESHWYLVALDREAAVGADDGAERAQRRRREVGPHRGGDEAADRRLVDRRAHHPVALREGEGRPETVGEGRGRSGKVGEGQGGE